MAEATAKKTTKATKSVSANVVAKRLDKVIKNTNNAIDDLKTDMATNQEAVMQAIANMAKNNPVSITKGHEAAEQELGKVHDIEEGVIEKSRLDNVNFQEFKTKAEIEAFMHEKVMVQIHSITSDEAGDVFDISVNGHAETFRMGEQKVVHRYIVEQLARAKPVHYTNEEYINSEGHHAVRHPARCGLRYPFATIGDSAFGNAWLKVVLAQP